MSTTMLSLISASYQHLDQLQSLELALPPISDFNFPRVRTQESSIRIAFCTASAASDR